MNWKNQLPRPVYDARPDWIALYDFAWESARRHRIALPGMPQSPYMDEAFCDTELWIWDSCFMALFCKYAPDAFPGVETLENFYRVLYENTPLPQIITRNAPAWTQWTIGQPAQVRIHIADNPPLFAWAELENFRMTGNYNRVRALLQRQVLQRHYRYFESLREPAEPPNRFVSNRTCLWSRPDGIGYHWEGGRSGMDNTPRGRRSASCEVHRPNDPDLLWVDALAQQALAARCIAELAEAAGDQAVMTEFHNEFRRKQALLERYYWSEQDHCYFDRYESDGSFCKVTTIASFWPALAGAAAPERVEQMMQTLLTPEKLGGAVPLLSLARDDGDFDPAGRYWRGGLWLPGAYMAIKSFDRYGHYAEATAAAERILEHQTRTWRDFAPHTIWECYSPTAAAPATDANGDPDARPDFCGWSALGPIALLLEDAIGLREADAVNRRLRWEPPREVHGRIGVEHYRFGEITADLICDEAACTVQSDHPFTLLLSGRELAIPAGKSIWHRTRQAAGGEQ